MKAVRDQFDVDMQTAKEVGQEARRILKAFKDEETNLTDDQAARLELKRAQRKAEMKLRSFLNQFTSRKNAMQRFNNMIRALWVGNLSTQIFNAVQSITVQIPKEIFSDVVDSAFRSVRRKMKMTNELDRISPGVSLRNFYLPLKYAFTHQRARAESLLAEYPEEFFKVYTGLQGDIDLGVNDVDHSHVLLPRLHTAIDYGQRYANFMAKISFAQTQEAHFRSAAITAAVEQTIQSRHRADRNLPANLDAYLETGRVAEIGEDVIKEAVEKALRVTFAEEMPAPVKAAYDQIDRFLPIFLNPVAFARFTYTVAKSVANAHLFGMIDAFDGNGYSTRSFAKGVYGYGVVGIALLMLEAFGGDDEEWQTLYFGNSEPVDVRRMFPLSAYVFTAHAIRNLIKGKGLPPINNFFEAYSSLELKQFERSAGYQAITDLWGALYEQNPQSFEDLQKSSLRLGGSVLTSFVRYLKFFRDAGAEFAPSERAVRNYKESALDGFMSEIVKNVPGAGTLYGAPVKVSPISGEPMETKHPLFSAVGVRFFPREYTSPELTAGESAAKKINDRQMNYGGEMTEAQKEAYGIRSEVKDAIRRGEISRFEAKELLDRYKKEGKISEKQRKETMGLLGKSELEEFVAKFHFSKPEHLKDLSWLLSKVTPEEKNAMKDELRKKFDNKKPSPMKNDLRKLLKAEGIF